MSLVDQLNEFADLSQAQKERLIEIDQATDAIFDVINLSSPVVGLLAVAMALGSMLAHLTKLDPPAQTRRAYEPLQREVDRFIDGGLRSLLERDAQKEPIQ